MGSTLPCGTQSNSFPLKGASGAGKTTAAQLIGRYWDTESGIISIGGTPLRDLDTESLMDLTAFVFQNVFLMEDTLFENIRMGSSVAEEQVIAAAKAWIVKRM